MWARKLAVAIGAVALAVMTATSAGANAEPTKSGSESFPAGSGFLRLTWAIGCGQITPNQWEGGMDYSPHWDALVVEKGQTPWKYAKVVYLWMNDGDTIVLRIYKQDIAPRNSVFDPPVLVEHLSVASGDGEGLTVRFAVSRDGRTWKFLTRSSLRCRLQYAS